MMRSRSKTHSTTVDAVDNNIMSWSARYGKRHQLIRITEFPHGVQPLRKVRLYSRCDHFVLQWWDPAAGRNLSDRVEGDLVAAIGRAREIDTRLEHFRSAGTGRSRLRHTELVAEYIADLKRRCEGGEIAARTVERYQSALTHYLAFVQKSATEAKFPWAVNVDRRFTQEFLAFLVEREVAPNGHSNAALKPLSSTTYVLDVARGMFAWAADPSRGNLMPTGFQNPFRGLRSRDDRHRRDLFGEPDITIEMAVEFISHCDLFQLRCFAPLVLYGLRAAEPCLIFKNDIKNDWLHVIGRKELCYETKGLCDKRLPLMEPMEALLCGAKAVPSPLLFPRRTVFSGTEQPPFGNLSLDELIREFESRLRRSRGHDTPQRERIRQQLLREAGGMDYDQLQGEFLHLAKSLHWPRQATLKDFRHLFSTSLENAGVPLFYRRYLMGQSPGRSAVVTYTHVNELRQQYQLAVDRTLGTVLDAIRHRYEQLMATPP